ncbi:hypothetical protein GGR57DRAFT_492180 [Xylariaceae sp. FL1272]|nr:hypothetical protein GGR57DRAFT_492180 [Xylariaceae sp. FL1272]
MPDTRGAALLALSITTAVLALATCILRYIVRTRLNQQLGWEDYSVGLAMLLGIIGISFTIVESVSRHDFRTALEYDYLAQPWLNMGSTLSKVSICLLVWRLVARLKVWRIVLALQIISLLVVNLAYTFTTLLQCRPLEKLWNTDTPGQCWSIGVQQDIGYFQGAFDIFTPLFIALFPIVVIQDLEIQRNVRFPFYLLTLMATIIAMLGILRTYNISLIQLDDQLMFRIIATIFAVLGQNLNIISANILPISSLFSKNIRPISQAINDAASVREIDVVSLMSKRDQASRATRRRSEGSTPMIEAAERDSLEVTPSTHEVSETEAWSLGIIKTVSVEVVEEDAVAFNREIDLADVGRTSRQQSWDRYLE